MGFVFDADGIFSIFDSFVEKFIRIWLPSKIRTKKRNGVLYHSDFVSDVPMVYSRALRRLSTRRCPISKFSTKIRNGVLYHSDYVQEIRRRQLRLQKEAR